MKKQITVSLFLLVCTIFANGFTLKAIPFSRTQPINIAAEPLALSKAVLTLQDLPPGFTDISDRMEALKKQWSDASGIKVESIFAYQKSTDKPLQVLLGATMQLPTQSDRAGFDDAIREGGFAQEILQTLNRNEKQFANLTPLPLAGNIGNLSSAWTTTGQIRERPTTIDAVIFRRENLGAFLITFYVAGDTSTIAIADLARKLDQRIVELVSPQQMNLNKRDRDLQWVKLSESLLFYLNLCLSLFRYKTSPKSTIISPQ